MKILTINAAFGFSDMDRLFTNIKRHVHMHGWGILAYEFFPILREELPQVSHDKRVAYARKHQNIKQYLDVVRQVNPDVLVLNEALYELYKDEIEEELALLSFRAHAWGLSTHYPGTTISLVLATKEPGETVQCVLPQRPKLGGGASMVGIRLHDIPVTVFGVHLTYNNPVVHKKQVAYVREMSEKEYALGREVVLIGDWNESEAALYQDPDFKALDLVSADPHEKATCPVFLPAFLQKPLDHIFVPPHWKRLAARTISTGSDHLALCVDVQSPFPGKVPE